MRLTLKKNIDLLRNKTDCAVIIVYGKKLGQAANRADAACQGLISEVVKRGDLDHLVGDTLILPAVPNIAASRILLVNVGSDDLQRKDLKRLARGVLSGIRDCGANKPCLHLAELALSAADQLWFLQYLSRLTHGSGYSYHHSKAGELSMLSDAGQAGIKAMQIELEHVGVAHRDAARYGEAIAQGVMLTRELGDTPGNICTPKWLAEVARKLVKQHQSLQAQVLGEAQMRKLKMGALLSVSAGSKQEAQLIILRHQGAEAKQRPVALVGKGITFDSGGISLKPPSAMDEMKYDMCGAASVFGVMHFAALLQLPINLVGVVAAAENMPSSIATKPGDVVESMSGQSVEVLNTDAEGRLVLCDALSYVKRFKPSTVVDIATLTGACIVALGREACALFSDDDQLAASLVKAGESADDRTWRLPLWPEYAAKLRSNFADVANIGGREAGTITAACFLQRFVEGYSWAHLDIAGVAWRGGSLKKGATGRPVPLLAQYLIDRAYS